MASVSWLTASFCTSLQKSSRSSHGARDCSHLGPFSVADLALIFIFMSSSSSAASDTQHACEWSERQESIFQVQFLFE